MPSPKSELKTVGKPERRVDSVKLATGRGTFVDDIALPGLLHVRILHSPHAHARITRIDASQARAMPGVACVLTHQDVPRVAYTTAGQGWPEPSPYDAFMLDAKVRFVGDRVAVAQVPGWPSAATRSRWTTGSRAPSTRSGRWPSARHPHETDATGRTRCGTSPPRSTRKWATWRRDSPRRHPE
jgi:hypothetical protein